MELITEMHEIATETELATTQGRVMSPIAASPDTTETHITTHAKTTDAKTNQGQVDNKMIDDRKSGETTIDAVKGTEGGAVVQETDHGGIRHQIGETDILRVIETTTVGVVAGKIMIDRVIKEKKAARFRIMGITRHLTVTMNNKQILCDTIRVKQRNRVSNR